MASLSGVTSNDQLAAALDELAALAEMGPNYPSHWPLYQRQAVLRAAAERLRDVAEQDAACDECRGNGFYWIDDSPRLCICVGESLADGGARLQSALEFTAVYATEVCMYGDGCPSNAGTRHGRCERCKARVALGIDTVCPRSPNEGAK